ncbi:MAG: leucine-rich repeat domain-containing protein [Bacteroidaceae bacterium]|nr:leucine-rich repeat domain-containing protein [Bacteroidaceae bacterium]
MKKIRLLLALVLASVSLIQGAWAERVAPTFPSNQAKTLESGQTYYLYNPGSDRFIYLSGSTVYAYPASYSALTVINVEGDVYNLKFDGTNYYLYSSGNSVNASTTSNSSYTQYRKYRIEATDGGYSIQRDYSYNETYYVGNATGNTSVVSNMTSGNIVWQLYDADGAAAIIRYRAKKALYDALVSAENYSLSFAVEEYEALYANDATTNEELTAAANAVNNALLWKDMLATGESEYPIYTQLTGNATWNYSSGKYSSTTIKNGEGGLKAIVEVDQVSTLVYNYKLNSNWYNYSFNVYLDGELYQKINNYEGYNNGKNQRYFIELAAGHHTIEWKAKSTSESNATTFYLQNIAVYKTPAITVNLTQAGSLGTEVLYNVDHIKEVRKLVIQGKMNSEDWERVNMMTNLFELDLTATDVTSLPAINPGSFFHKILLPAGLTTIETSALTNLPLEEITFPATLTTIGESAFKYTRIKEALIPENVSSIGQKAFAYNQSLCSVVWPSQVKSIPDYCFDGDYMINAFELPEGLTTIGSYAMRDNYNCNYQLPSTINSIGAFAFEDADKIETIVIPNNTTIKFGAFCYCSKLKKVTIGEGVSFGYDMYYSGYEGNGSSAFTDRNTYSTFYQCASLEEIEFPTSFTSISYENMLYGCTALQKVIFKSATLIDGAKYSSFFSNLGTNISVYVPSYLVNAYKLDSYWYNYNIMGFSTADVTDWRINSTLTFYSQDRFEGTPNVNLQQYGVWTINGDASQNINNFYSWYNSQEYSGEVGPVSKFISNCDNVNISGIYRHGYYLYNKYKYGSSNYNGRWHFISLPFDIKVSDITTFNYAHFAIRYYDGASRAVNGTGGNWKDYAANDIISAGTGFIMQASKPCWVYFYALDNESKQNVASNKIFIKALDANDSEQSSNKGWNLVGNPWLAYYNIHKLNFTGAITVYDGYNRTYTAYSIIDDDYALRPNQAFFVQCPDEVTEISFPVDGRQMTSVIESQNGVKGMSPQAPTRWLVDVELSNGEQSDKTRFVLNEEACIAYETTCDASKFFEDGTACPQLYTIEAGEPLAINERPMSDGIVALGMTIAQSGTYTISTPRNDFQHIWLIDLETGKETDLCNGIYSFSAEAGTDETRFMLSLNASSVVTKIDAAKAEEFGNTHSVYTLDGRQVTSPTQKGIYIVNGKKVIVK